MPVNKDFEDLLKSLNNAKARYLVVGAYAVIYYTEPRYTKDIDIWVDATIENAQKVYRALKHFGAPLQNIEVADFANSNLFYQVGIEPNRIDILMKVEGVRFETAWKKRKRVTYGNQKMIIMGRDELIRSKKKAGRDQDLIDLKKLLKMKNR